MVLSWDKPPFNLKKACVCRKQGERGWWWGGDRELFLNYASSFNQDISNSSVDLRQMDRSNDEVMRAVTFSADEENRPY